MKKIMIVLGVVGLLFLNSCGSYMNQYNKGKYENLTNDGVEVETNFEVK